MAYTFTFKFETFRFYALFKNLLSFIQLPAVSYFSSKVKEIAHVAHERQARSEFTPLKKRRHRPRRLSSLDSRVSRLALAACLPPIL